MSGNRGFAVKKWILRVVAGAGLVTFLTFFTFTYAVPGWAENFAFEFVEFQVNRQINYQIDVIEPPEGDSAIARLAGRIYSQNQETVLQLKQFLKDRCAVLIDAALAEVRDPTCECRAGANAILTNITEFAVASLRATDDRLISLMQGAYMRVVAELTRDLRIFAASNAVVFLLLAVASFMKPPIIRRVLFPAALMAAGTIFLAYCYLFQQNWFLTIVHSNYIGAGYLAALAAMFFLICDIAFNEFRLVSRALLLSGWAIDVAKKENV